jgi:hypothetical protein
MEAKEDVIAAHIDENKAAKEKEIADWNSFKIDAERSTEKIEKDLKNLEARIERANSLDKQKLKNEYNKSKTDLDKLKDKLHRRSDEFETEIKTFSLTVTEKNQSFKREFKHDMDAFSTSFKDLFKDNVK